MKHKICSVNSKEGRKRGEQIQRTDGKKRKQVTDGNLSQPYC